MNVSDEQFEQMISQAMNELPEGYVKRLNNVAITFDDDPTPAQRQKLKLREGHTLFGLYEGVPPIKRSGNYSMILPDKITIFKNPITKFAQNIAELKRQIKHTLWHEIGHHYGLDHGRIHDLENGNERH